MASQKKKKAPRPRVKHVKTGDNVIVVAGNDKGSTGEVRFVDHPGGRVLVEGVNMRWRHRRATGQGPDQKGERVQEESTIHASNVMLLDPATGRGTRKRQKES